MISFQMDVQLLQTQSIETQLITRSPEEKGATGTDLPLTDVSVSNQQ